MFVFVFRAAPLVPEDTGNVFQQVVGRGEGEFFQEDGNTGTQRGTFWGTEAVVSEEKGCDAWMYWEKEKTSFRDTTGKDNE